MARIKGVHNSRKTHCKYGHEFTPENTLIYKKKGHGPWRVCRICSRQKAASQYRKRRTLKRLGVWAPSPLTNYPPAAARFWRRVKKTKTCWLWTGALAENGYGHLHWDGQQGWVHRFAYELMVGPIPPGMTLDHLCRNRACVNPEHLEAVSHRENVLRGVGPTAVNAKKTHCKRGHPLSGDNLWVRKTGHRQCKRCGLDRQRKQMALLKRWGKRHGHAA